MAPWNTREALAHQVVTLCQQGLTRRAIARALSISRNTVRKLLVAHERARAAPHTALAPRSARAPRPQKVDEHRGAIADLLARYPQITAQRVFEELRAQGFAGGYTAVKRTVRAARPRLTPTPSLPTPDYGPGEMAESDWSPYTIDFTHALRQTVQVFSYRLVYSRRNGFGIYPRCNLHALMDGHVAVFARFGGAARACKYDGQKAVVLGWEGRQAIYNPRFLAFATHYAFRPEACRPGHPNDKPGVERGFWEFERSFLNGRSFRDVEDMRGQLATWQRDVCDVRKHKTLKRTALEMFAEESDALLSLPAHPYDTARVVYRVCTIDGFVAWEGNRYAVPYEHVTDILPIRIAQRELFVYAADLRCVATHELAPRGAGKDIAPPGTHQPWRTGSGVVDLDQLRVAFEQMGPSAGAFFAGLMTATPRIAGYHARQILLLRERYATSDLDDALGHAQSYGAFEQKAVARILAARAAPRRLAEYVAEETARRLEERLGADDTRPRDLDEYDRLPLASSSTPSRQERAEETPCPNPSEQVPQVPTKSRSGSGNTSNSSD